MNNKIAFLTAIIILMLNLHSTAIAQNAFADNKLIDVLKKNNIQLNDGHILIPHWVKHIKIDIGLSYSAPITQKWLEHEKNLLVFAFEPNPTAVASIKNPKNVALPNHGKPLEHHYINNKVFIIPVALGSKHATLDFYITELDIGCSSLYKPKASFQNIKDVIKVDVFRLDSFLKLIPWDQVKYIEYIKIDAQGHDLEIVKGMGEYIAKVVYITLEPEDYTYEGCQENNLNNIIAYMKSKNFVLVKNKKTSDPTFLNKNLRYASYLYIEQ